MAEFEREEIKEELKEVVEEVKTQSKNKMSKGKKIVIIAAVAVGLLIAAFVIGKICGTSKVTLTGLGGSFRDIGQLQVQGYDYTGIIKIQDSNKIWSLNIPFTEKLLIYSIDGHIKAGIDMTAVTDEDIVVEKNDDGSAKSVTVNLPAVTITDSYIDTNTRHELYDLKNLFNQLDTEDLSRYETALKDYELNKALDNGLVEKAQDQAKELISRMIRFNQDYKNADIIINIADSNIAHVDIDEEFNDCLS